MSDTLQILKNALIYFVAECHGPLPKDYYVAQHWGMAGAHAFLTNGLISIYEVRSRLSSKATNPDHSLFFL